MTDLEVRFLCDCYRNAVLTGQLTHASAYRADGRHWCWEVSGRRVLFRSADLLDQAAFRSVVLDALGVRLPRLDDSAFERTLDALVAGARRGDGAG